MKLPSQKYRKAVSSLINELATWRHSWMAAEAGSVRGAQAHIWYLEAKQRLLEDLGIQLHSEDTAESLQIEIKEAYEHLDMCQELEDFAAKPEPRPDVTTYVPVVVTKGGAKIELWEHQTAQYDLCTDRCQEIYNAAARFGYIETVEIIHQTYTAEEFDQFEHTLEGYVTAEKAA